MGYGEVGGGGSVDWVIVHGSDGVVKNGRDQKPDKGSDGKFGKFIMVINGKRTEYNIEDNPSQIQIYWPPHTPEAIQELNPKIEEGRRRNRQPPAARA